MHPHQAMAARPVEDRLHPRAGRQCGRTRRRHVEDAPGLRLAQGIDDFDGRATVGDQAATIADLTAGPGIEYGAAQDDAALGHVRHDRLAALQVGIVAEKKLGQWTSWPPFTGISAPVM